MFLPACTSCHWPCPRALSVKSGNCVFFELFAGQMVYEGLAIGAMNLLAAAGVILAYTSLKSKTASYTKLYAAFLVYHCIFVCVLAHPGVVSCACGCERMRAWICACVCECAYVPPVRSCFLHMASNKSMRKTGAAARRRYERIARAGRGMRASRSDARVASQAFSRTHTHESIWGKHTLANSVRLLVPILFRHF